MNRGMGPIIKYQMEWQQKAGRGKEREHERGKKWRWRQWQSRDRYRIRAKSGGRGVSIPELGDSWTRTWSFWGQLEAINLTFHICNFYSQVPKTLVRSIWKQRSHSDFSCLFSTFGAQAFFLPPHMNVTRGAKVGKPLFICAAQSFWQKRQRERERVLAGRGHGTTFHSENTCKMGKVWEPWCCLLLAQPWFSTTRRVMLFR